MLSGQETNIFKGLMCCSRMKVEKLVKSKARAMLLNEGNADLIAMRAQTIDI